MPRARTHLTWRTHRDEQTDTSNDACLQTLAAIRSEKWPYLKRRWVTVARGNEEDVKAIAQALNRARFTLFDLRPEKPCL